MSDYYKNFIGELLKIKKTRTTHEYIRERQTHDKKLCSRNFPIFIFF